MDTSSGTALRRTVIRDHISTSLEDSRIIRFPVSRPHLYRTLVSIREFPDTSLFSLQHRPDIRNIMHRRTIRTVIRDPGIPRHPVHTADSPDMHHPGIIRAASPDIRQGIHPRRRPLLHIRDSPPVIRETECPVTGEALFRKRPTVPDIPVPDMNPR